MTTGAKMQDDPQRVAATTENLARHFGLPEGTTTLELLDWLVCSRAELAGSARARPPERHERAWTRLVQEAGERLPGHVHPIVEALDLVVGLPYAPPVLRRLPGRPAGLDRFWPPW